MLGGNFVYMSTPQPRADLFSLLEQQLEMQQISRNMVQYMPYAVSTCESKMACMVCWGRMERGIGETLYRVVGPRPEGAVRNVEAVVPTLEE